VFTVLTAAVQVWCCHLSSDNN